MLTIPNEMVPLQMARGVLPVLSRSPSGFSLPRSRVVDRVRLRAVFGAIPNIKGITSGR